MAPSLKHAALSLIRRGPRTVDWTGPGLGFGNFLYLWQAAFRERAAGRDAAVLHRPEMDRWLALFPRLAELTIDRARVRFTDRRRMHNWSQYGVDFDEDSVRDFAAGYLFGDRGLGTLPTDVPPGRVTVNVRRGDYYSVPRFRAVYSLDIAAYLHEALAVSTRVSGEITELLVVSDDPRWCREHLGGLARDGRAVEFVPPGSSPLEHLRLLAGSRRLILANSTFSYWGAYLSNAHHGDNHLDVVAPWFHRRDIHGGWAFQLNPAWTVVRDIPGGWAPAD